MRSTRSTETAMPSVFTRAAAVMTAATVLLLAPGIAQAAFTTGARGQMSTSTLSLAQPVGTLATSICVGRDLTITFFNYGYVPRASAFRVEVFQDANDTAPQFVDRGPDDFSPITVKFTGAKAPRPYNVRGLYTTVGGKTWIGQPHPGTTVSC